MTKTSSQRRLSTIATLDHLVVTAPNLKAGVQYVRDALGVTPELGGKHLRMGTHNCLLRLADTVYLEVIAVDPNAPYPDRPRWFGLDALGGASAPRLAAWVARTGDIRQTVAHCSETVGIIEPMSRGDLHWLITVTEDGSLPLGGVAPILIEWQAMSHPALRMRDEGCKFLALELQHPEPGRVERLLQSINLGGEWISVSQCEPQKRPSLVATIETPQGVKILSGA